MITKSGTDVVRWIVAGLLIAGFGGWLILRPFPRTSTPESSPAVTPPVDFPLPAMSLSPFLNTTQGDYVGSKACIECHTDEHASYLLTAHSRALGEIDIQKEPPDANYDHKKSGRSYSVYRKHNRLWHRESLRLKDGTELVLADYPLKYVIGSGHHSRSYIVEDDGFLVESPITWYASRNEWDMSPGYDVPRHGGFERATDIGCVTCHVGEVETVDGSFQRLNILEAAISCENCHGPGSLHVESRRHSDKLKKSPDRTIVNPQLLSRDLQEAICSQCHLRGEATVFLRGRGIVGFRPGLPLHDFRIDYALKNSGKSMKVTGHVQQMHLSRCYQHSESLTCTTCHNPHDKPSPQEKVSHYKHICLTCHDQQHCGFDFEARLRTDPQDNCVACHMPQVPTDIPHFAFTHHRIAVHQSEPQDSDEQQTGTLVEFQDISHLSEIDRQRGLGLAYLELSSKQPNPRLEEVYQLRALEILKDVSQLGMHEAEVEAAMARIYWMQESPHAVGLAESVLKSDELYPGTRINALFVLGESYFRQGKFNRAIERLEQLVRLRRHSEDWLLLGLCKLQTGDADGASKALQRAKMINPSRGEIYLILADISRSRGRQKEEAAHRKIGKELLMHSP